MLAAAAWAPTAIAQGAPAGSPAPETFATLAPGDLLASNLVDLVVTHDGRRVGEIEDVVFDANRQVRAYVVALGGSRDGGTVRHVALVPTALTVTRAPDGAWKAETALTAAELAAAPTPAYKSGFNAE